MDIFLKAVKVIINTLTTIIIVIGVVFLILYAIGIQPFVVESGSMEPNIKVGSICFVNKHTKYENIKVNDIIAFNTSLGKKATHRVVEITEEGMKTKGDANAVEDEFLTTRESYIGKNVFSIPKIGYLVKETQNPRGRIILITCVIVLLAAGILIGEPKKSKHSAENNK